MKILKRSFKKMGEGYIIVIPTDDQDLWHIYNLINQDDLIKMRTPRKIVTVNEIGLKSARVKKIVLTLVIVNIDYFADGDRLAISIKGRNAQENEYLKMGQYHTFRIQMNNKITIFKKCWTTYQINLLKQISNISHGVQIAAMVMDEGVAHLCYVKASITLLVHKVQKNVSKKTSGQQIYVKSLHNFFLDCYRSLRSIDLSNIKCFIIASPGFINQQFLKYSQQQCEKQNDKIFKKDLETKFMLVKCSTGYLQSLNQVLADPRVMARMENTKAISQTRVLDKFYDMMKKNQNMIAYGEKEVFKCIEMQAVDTLLISDFLFRTKNLKKRMTYNKIVEDVKSFGGQTVIFSTLHPSGQKLKSITGIAAILRFEVMPQQEQQQAEEVQIAEENENQEQGIMNMENMKISDDQESGSQEQIVE